MSGNDVNDQSRVGLRGPIPWWAKGRIWIVTLLTLGAALTVAMYIWRVTLQRETARINSQFAQQCGVQVQNVEFRLQQSQNVLQFLRSFFAASEDVYRYEFAEFCQPHLASVPVVKFVAWAPQVYPDGFEAFSEFADRHGVSNFEFWEFDSEGVPTFVQTRPVHFPVLFIEPTNPFQRLAGLDIASLPEWVDALEEAILLGETNSQLLEGLPIMDEVASPPGESSPVSDDPKVEAGRMSTGDGGDSPAGSSGHDYLLIVTPVFFSGHVPEEPLDRITQCGGVLLCVVDIMELFRPLKRWATVEGVKVRLIDIHGTDRQEIDLAGNETSVRGGVAEKFPPSTWDIRLPGRTWRVVAQPSAAYVALRRGPGSWGILATGVLCSFLIGLYVNVIGGRSLRIQQLVAERTQELQETNQRLAQEIQQREAMEKELRDSEALYSSLVESLPLHILRKDREGRFTFANTAFCRLIGKPRSAIYGKTDFDFYPADLVSKYRRDDRRVMETGEVFEDIEEYEQDGETRYVQVLKSPVRDSFGNIVGVQVAFWDVTEKVVVQRALEKAKQAAEEANRAKSDFLANMSHEIRTPMNAILGMAQLLEETPLNSEQREYLRIIRESGDNLLALINTILDFSKIEAGRIELDAVEFQLREIVGDAMKTLAVRAHKKQLELACRVAPDVPDDLVGDPIRLRQILINLVDNAVKFTDRGEVVVDIICRECTEHEAFLQFSVRDTGIGIPPDKQKLIFAAFEQADKSTTRKYGGTGLGLSICTRLVALMGGTIDVESQPGVGSTFRFTARFRRAGDVSRKLPPVDLREYADRQILVVDDNATNRIILNEMISNWGLKSQLATCGEEALRMVTDEAGKIRFSVVITDMRMPGMDGMTLIRQLRRRFGAEQVAIIVLSSEDRPSDSEFFRRFEVSAVLRKPVKQSELYNILAEILGLAFHPESKITIPPSFPELPPLRILLVEDSPFNQQVAIGLLEKRGHRVTTVSNGKEALDVLRNESFDVILMDIQMPEMDGLTATREIRAREERLGLPRTPIIAMTAHALKSDREEALHAGMDGYVAKPIVVETFFQTIADVLHHVRGVNVGDTQILPSLEPLVQSDGNPDCQTSQPGEPSEPQPRSEQPETTPPGNGSSDRVPEPASDVSDGAGLVDWPHALRAAGGDQKLLQALVETFLEEMPRQRTNLEKALSQKDWPTARRAAHTLGGSFRHFGAQSAAQTALQAEKALAEGHDTEALRALVQKLYDDLEKILNELRKYWQKQAE
jgi:two-component system sensor histidine kinase/response regulator